MPPEAAAGSVPERSAGSVPERSAGSVPERSAGSPVPAEGTSASTTPEWAVSALDKVDDLVAKVRSNTTDRLVRVARTVVFGILAGIMGVTALVLGVIAAVRGLDELIPGPVWGVYLPLGAIFVLAGAFLWSKKSPSPHKH